jgi:hypothetical protein
MLLPEPLRLPCYFVGGILGNRSNGLLNGRRKVRCQLRENRQRERTDTTVTLDRPLILSCSTLSHGDTVCASSDFADRRVVVDRFTKL